MRKAQKIAAAVLVLLILGTLYGIWRTHEVEAPLELQGKVVKQPAAQKSVVDQSPLKIAQQLAQLALTPEEKSFAQEALRLADFEVDLTFDTALHDARLHPPPLGPEAKEIEQRMEKAQRLLRADQDRAKALSEQVAKLPENKREAAELDLVQTEADLDLDQDEVDDAKQDFIAAGGDLAEKIQTMRKEHEDAAHGTASALPTGGPPPEQHGLVHRAQQWFGLHRKQMNCGRPSREPTHRQIRYRRNTTNWTRRSMRPNPACRNSRCTRRKATRILLPVCRLRTKAAKIPPLCSRKLRILPKIRKRWRLWTSAPRRNENWPGSTCSGSILCAANSTAC